MAAHSEMLLSKCAQFREQGEFIDVSFIVEGVEFEAHRIVLAANSGYFHAKFAMEEVIDLNEKNISAAAMKIVMDSIYGGEINVNDENVSEVLTAADDLQVASVVEQCCKYLIKLRFDVQTYCRVIMFSNQHNLKELKEATESKMASIYKEICDKEEFLSDMNADVLSALLSRDDLIAPSEDFVFQSVMQWIKYRKEERMNVAAKVIGAVRLGLVDVDDVVKELDTDEMRDIKEISLLLNRTLIYNRKPSSSSAFALERGKSMSSMLVAIRPKGDFLGFDAQSKEWRELSSVEPLTKAAVCECVELIGNYLYVKDSSNDFFCYDIVGKEWIRLPPIHTSSPLQVGSLCHLEDHLYAICTSSESHRYRIATDEPSHWQSVAGFVCEVGHESFCNKAAAVYKSCIYVLCAQGIKEHEDSSLIGTAHNSLLYCFDSKKNVWEQKASTNTPHFGSSLLVVNNSLYVAGGKCSFKGLYTCKPCGDSAEIEVYDDTKNEWSVVRQPPMPKNNLGAVVIDGRVYFIINSFPVDSGITVPPGEVYPVILGDWKKLGNVDKNAVLCYMPVKNSPT